MKTQELPCVFCGGGQTVTDPWHGLLQFTTFDGDYSIQVVVLKNKRGDDNKVVEITTKPICLSCLTEFLKKMPFYKEIK